LEIKEYYCPQCQTSVRGRFAVDMFAGLNEMQLDFIKQFLLSQGNIREMEKRLNISYPTVKSRLADIIAVIAPQEPPASPISDVLDDLGQGVYSVEEAVRLIRERRKS
jgi:hypothetical protein